MKIKQSLASQGTFIGGDSIIVEAEKIFFLK